ncbi:MAG: type II secretion system protein GspD [Chlamydiia bacterium]|nr:type II secretion system protein GspD [Chlamydiia bacterium]
MQQLSYFLPILLLGVSLSSVPLNGEPQTEIELDTFNLIADAAFDEPTQISPNGIKSITRCCPGISDDFPLLSCQGPYGKKLISPEHVHSDDPEVESPSEVKMLSSHVEEYPKETILQFDGAKRREETQPVSSKSLDEGYTLNYESIPIIELIRIISEISKTNFVFDSADLNFNISIVSDEPSSVEDLLASLLQILRMHGFSVVDQGSNILIYQNESLSKVSTVVTDETAAEAEDLPLVTRVFRLYNISPVEIVKVVKPLLSKEAIVEISPETRHLVVSDITANVDKIGDLILALDTPNTALDVAQYHVKSAHPMALVAYARQIVTPLAQTNAFQMIAQPSSNTIFIVSTPYLINKALQVLTSLDTIKITSDMAADLPSSDMVNNNFFLYKLRYHDGDEVAQALRDIGANLQRTGLANMDLVNAINSLQWIRANNSIVFSGTDKAIRKLQQLLEEVDSAPKQVYIEVLIIDTALSNSLDFGVEWVALGNEQNKLAFASGFLGQPPASAPTGSLGITQNALYGGARSAFSTPPPDPARGSTPGTGGDIPLTTGFGLGIVGNVIRHNGQPFLTLGALISALETESDTKIVLNPRIMSEDSKEANLFVGSNVPYQTTSTVVRDTGSVTQNIQYEDVGVQLRVTPTITPGNVVTLQIDQSVSEVTSPTATIIQASGTSTSLLAPTTMKLLTTTRVHVPDGSFLVMSGHVRDETRYSRRGIPCLGTLPLIGPTFSRTEENRDKRNLIIFIRPHVITTGQEAVNFSNLEGYQFNLDSDPCSLKVCPPEEAPEAQSYPASKCY